MAKWTIVDEDGNGPYDLSEHMEEPKDNVKHKPDLTKHKVEIKDNVNSPDHYNTGSIECIEYLKDNMSYEAYLGYLEGNCKKYLHRCRYKKKPVEDLKKARWYLGRLIEELDGPDE